MVPTRGGDAVQLDPACPTHRLMGLLGDQWSMRVIIALRDTGELRSADLMRALVPVSRKMLTQTLRRLEDADLVTRTVEATVPVSVSYVLTDLGESLYVALRPVRAWAQTHLVEPAPIPVHG